MRQSPRRDLATEPPQLRRSRLVVDLGVQAQDLPPGDSKRVVGGRGRPQRLLPVGDVALFGEGAVVVPRSRRGQGCDSAVGGLVVPLELFGGPPVVDVAQVEEAIRVGVGDVLGDRRRFGLSVPPSPTAHTSASGSPIEDTKPPARCPPGELKAESGASSKPTMRLNRRRRDQDQTEHKERFDLQAGEPFLDR